MSPKAQRSFSLGAFLAYFQRLDDDHYLRIAARTYALCLSLSFAPALLPILSERWFSRRQWSRLVAILRNELGAFHLAFSMSVAVAGGEALDHFCDILRSLDPHVATFCHWTCVRPSTLEKLLVRVQLILASPYLCTVARTFICNSFSAFVAINLLQASGPFKRRITAVASSCPQEAGREGRSPTLNLTLLLLVRAIDCLIQRTAVLWASKSRSQPSSFTSTQSEEDQNAQMRTARDRVVALTNKLDGLIFWAASARIMWCFFYLPERLPRSYVKWIFTLAKLDKRLLETLRGLRDGSWRYGKGGSQESRSLLMSMSQDMGYPDAWGDPVQIPAYGGSLAADRWKSLGVHNRNGVGGLPCDLVHGGIGGEIVPGGVGASCIANASVRGSFGFVEGLALYAPMHVLSILFTAPRKLLSLQALRTPGLAIFRSSLFLSTFISSLWAAVCITRTLVLARFFPNLSHNFFDGPHGCTLVGCLTCGSSIWIEQGRRRGEIALYVLPRALRSLLNESWTKNSSWKYKLIEQIVFVCSLASILTASRHFTESLRGLTAHAVMFARKGISRSR